MKINTVKRKAGVGKYYGRETPRLRSIRPGEGEHDAPEEQQTTKPIWHARSFTETNISKSELRNGLIIIDIDPEDGCNLPTSGVKIHPVPVLQNLSKAFQQPDLALEGRLAGSDEIKLIHGAHSFPAFI